MNKKQAIIDETYRLFAEKGYNLSLSEVTKALGLKKQSIYNYFSSKNELINEMLKIQIEGYCRNLKKVVKNTQNQPPKERLFRLMKSIVDFFSDSRKLRTRKWICLDKNRIIIDELDILLKAYQLQIKKYIKEIIQDGMEQGNIRYGNIEVIVNFYIIMVRGIIDGMFIMDEIYEHQRTFETMFEEYWKLICKDEEKNYLEIPK